LDPPGRDAATFRKPRRCKSKDCVRANRLFAVCDGKVKTITDSETGKQIAKASIDEGPDAAGFDAKNQVAFSSNGDTGTLSIVGR
jgi:hypothetical protein